MENSKISYTRDFREKERRDRVCLHAFISRSPFLLSFNEKFAQNFQAPYDLLSLRSELTLISRAGAVAGNSSLPNLTADIWQPESPARGVHRSLSRRVARIVSRDQRGHTRVLRRAHVVLLFSECPAVTGSNIVFLLLCPSPVSSLPYRLPSLVPPSLSPSI